MDDIYYSLTTYSSDENLNTLLLKKNIEKYVTIYNTFKVIVQYKWSSCAE
ncbi:MAG: hypothetical protein ACI8ZO_000050 [Flavobacteriales bacterium]|jgi:hypothetical protein